MGESSNGNGSGKKRMWNWRHVCLACSIVVGLWVLVEAIVGSVFALFVEGNKLESFGQFGDSFGLVNSLFSGLAFAVLIVTLWMQKEELQDQRKVLKLQQEELELQRKELEGSTDALQLTSFLSALTALHQRYESQIKDGSASPSTRVAYRMLSIQLQTTKDKIEHEGAKPIQELNTQPTDRQLVNSWAEELRGIAHTLDQKQRQVRHSGHPNGSGTHFTLNAAKVISQGLVRMEALRLELDFSKSSQEVVGTITDLMLEFERILAYFPTEIGGMRAKVRSQDVIEPWSNANKALFDFCASISRGELKLGFLGPG